MLSRKFFKIAGLLILFLLFLGLFINFFGMDNILIAMYLILLAVMLLSADLSKKPIKSLIIITSINIILVVGGFISYLLPILGFFIIFAIIFSTTYIISHNLKNPLYFPFILGFLFILSNPMDFNQLKIKLFAVIIGSIFVVGLNVLVNRNKFSKSIKNELLNILKDINSSINHKLEGKEINIEDINNSFDSIKKHLNQHLVKNYFSEPIYARILNISAALEQIGFVILKTNFSRDELLKLQILTNKLKYNLSNNHQLISIINDFIEDNSTFNHYIIYNLKIISYELGNPAKNKFNDIEVPLKFRLWTYLKEDLSINSIKFTFAFKLAITLATIEFIGIYFHIPNFKWVAYTIIVILQPCLDNTLNKAKLRMEGTIIGILSFMTIDYLILIKTSMFYFNSAPTIVIILSIFGFSYVYLTHKKYYGQVIFITIISLLAAESTTPGVITLEERFIFILIGCIIALIMNYFVFPTTYKKENTDLLKKYHEINVIESKNIKNALLFDLNENESILLILKANIIKDTISKNNKQSFDENIAKILELESMMTSIILLLINLAKTNSISKKTRESAINYLKTGISGDNEYCKSLTEFKKLEKESQELIKNL